MPLKIKVRSNHINGLSDETKILMKLRDIARSTRSPSFKTLRNKCLTAMRKDTRRLALYKISKNPHNYWKVLKKLEQGSCTCKMKLVEYGKSVVDESQLANIRNEYFHSKVETLRREIPVVNDEEPIARLEAKVKNRKLHFALHEVLEDDVFKVMEEL